MYGRTSMGIVRTTYVIGADGKIIHAFPKVKVEQDRIYVIDGPVWTSAGMTATIDLALAMVERDLGLEVARSVARKLVVYHRRAGGQSQFSTLLELEPKSDRIQNALAYAKKNLHTPLSVERLAEAAGMSLRLAQLEHNPEIVQWARNVARILRGRHPSALYGEEFASAADVAITWAHRDSAEAGTSDVLARTLKTLQLPAGDYYAWVACESLIAKALRAQLIADHGANPKWIRAAGYWRRGAIAVHETHND